MAVVFPIAPDRPKKKSGIGAAIGGALGSALGGLTALIPGAGPFIAPVASTALGAAGAEVGKAATPGGGGPPQGAPWWTGLPGEAVRGMGAALQPGPQRPQQEEPPPPNMGTPNEYTSPEQMLARSAAYQTMLRRRRMFV